MAEINDEIAAGVFERFGQEVLGVARLDGEGDGAYLERLGRMMASQRDDVRASLLASHDRDAVVRRKVAEDVKTVARNGARRAAMATHPVTADDVAVEVGVAELAAAHESAKAWMGRERLIAVQRLLGASFDAPTRRQSDEAVSDALSILRSLLGGE